MKQKNLWSVLVATSLVLAGCQAPGMLRPSFAIQLPQALIEPAALDWSHQLVAGRTLSEQRGAAAKRQVLAFPTQPANWPVTMATTFGLSATDTTPNGAATTYNPILLNAELADKVFLVTKEGYFVKADRTNPATYSKILLGSGQTFSRTYVTTSPKATRAYVLSDQGRLFIVNTLGTMSVVSVDLSANVPTGADCQGIAPTYDPYTCDFATDTRDEVHVPLPNGKVLRYEVKVASTGAWPPSVTQTGNFDIATTITPLQSTEKRKIKAPAIVLNRQIYVGDQAGNLHRYDPVTAANTVLFALGAPINTAPALEFNAANVIDHAFVNVGASCAWVTFSTSSVSFSRPLFLDDGDAGKPTAGYLWDYKYSNNVNTEYLAAQDALTINTESPDYNLPLSDGTSPSIRYVNELVPAETNSRTDGTQPLGGPMDCYLRWYSTTTYETPPIIQKINLLLRSNLNLFYSKVPEVRVTSHLENGSTTQKWSSASMTNATRPSVGTANVGQFIGSLTNAGNHRYTTSDYSLWDVTAAFSSVRSDYALALKMNFDGQTVLWPWGPFGGTSAGTPPGLKRKATQVDAPQFYNNVADQTLTSSTKIGNKSEKRPVLEIQTSKAAMPTPSIETPPIIDAARQRIYVFYTNAVFSISTASGSAFADSEYNPGDKSGTKYTIYNVTHRGDRNNGASFGSTYNTNLNFVGNFAAPVLDPNPTPSFLYVLDRYPAALDASKNPTSWTHTINRLTLPIGTTRALATQPFNTAIAEGKSAANYMAVDGNTNNLYFGLGDGKLYQFDK